MKANPYIAIRGRSKSFSYRRRYTKELAAFYGQYYFNLSLKTDVEGIAKARAAVVSKLFDRNQQPILAGKSPEPISITQPETTKTRKELAEDLLSQFVSLSRDTSSIPEDAHTGILFALQEYAEDETGEVVSERVPVVKDAITLLNGGVVNENPTMTTIVRLYEELKGDDYNPKQIQLALRDWISEMGDKPINTYRRVDAQRFANSYLLAGKASGTASRRIGTLSAAITKVSLMYEMDVKNVFKGIELNVSHKQRHQMTPEDEDTVRQLICSKDDTALVPLILYRTGADDFVACAGFSHIEVHIVGLARLVAQLRAEHK